MNIDLRVAGKRNMRMHSEWVVATRQSPWNLAHAHLSNSLYE